MGTRTVGSFVLLLTMFLVAFSGVFVTTSVTHAASNSAITYTAFAPTISRTNIAGNYTGSYTLAGTYMVNPIDILITQTNATLGGTTNESGTISANTGTMSSSGNFFLVELWNGSGNSTLSGSLVGAGHIEGTWVSGSASGTWDVTFVPTISGHYTGSWTQDGISGTFPMQIQVTQVGSLLGGITTEFGSTSNNAGRINPDGSFDIVENWGGGSAFLIGTFSTPGHPSGTWGSGTVSNGSSGTWDVTAS